MPELPEVETVLRTLEYQIKGSRIKDIIVLYPNLIEGDVNTFINTLKGQRFNKFLRRGKYLLFEMDNILLVSHLRMEGKYYVYPSATTPLKHSHIIFKLDDGREIHYNDTRKFGRFKLMPLKDSYKEFLNLGVEPLSDDLNVAYLYPLLHHKHKAIKALLLDQSLIAGIGNIYADEILFDASINPLNDSSYLSYDDVNRIVEASKKILNEAIKAGGTTIRSYTSSLGVTGLFQMSLHAYGKKDKKCERCGSQIIKTVVATRGTYYCPNCQKIRRKIAITGSIGTGKSALSRIIKDKGYYVFDADKVNAELLNDKDVLIKIKKLFNDVFDGEILNKKKLSVIIFKDSKRKKELEAIMHPLIKEKMLEMMDKYPLFFAEIPLLFETEFKYYFSDNVVVSAKEDIVINRLKERGVDKDKYQLCLANQRSLDDKIKLADYVIENNGSLNDLEKKAERWLKDIHVGQ